MRIGFVVPRCRPTNSHGRYVIELARRMAVSEDVKIYSGARCGSLGAATRFRYLPVVDWPMIARLTTAWVASAPVRLFDQFDILHTQGADFPIGNVVTAHCCTAAMRKTVVPASHRRLSQALGARAEAFTLGKRSTRAVIAVSEKVKREIEHHYGIHPSIISVIRPGVDLAAFRPVEQDRRQILRAQIGLRESDFAVLYVGADYRLKGFAHLVAAVRRVDWPIRVIAVGPSLDAELRYLLGDDIDTGRVILKPRTTDIAQHYAIADCFVLPTHYDTFSLVTLEAMASGLPVIVSRAAGIAECLTNGVDALLLDEPGDQPSLSEYLTRLIRDVDCRRRLSEGARRTAERYSWDDVASRTLAVYRSVAA